jgi:hypothetical protein
MSRELGRGLYPATCERCGRDGICRLRQFDNRYLWSCETGCVNLAGHDAPAPPKVVEL